MAGEEETQLERLPLDSWDVCRMLQGKFGVILSL